MNIPAKVKEAARNEGCNSIKYVGRIGKSEYYGIGEVDENGRAVPTGLPALVKWDGVSTDVIAGEEALELLSRL